MQKRIDGSGPNGAWILTDTEPIFQNKKLSPRTIREELIACLRDEIATLEDKINWLECELEESNDVIYRLQIGLPVSWDCSYSQETEPLNYVGGTDDLRGP